jgi:hypothetical protein
MRGSIYAQLKTIWVRHVPKILRLVRYLAHLAEFVAMAFAILFVTNYFVGSLPIVTATAVCATAKGLQQVLSEALSLPEIESIAAVCALLMSGLLRALWWVLHRGSTHSTGFRLH